MSKQKVIAILRHLTAYANCGCAECRAGAERREEEAYDRIAPLMVREFPEGLFVAQLHGLYYLSKVMNLGEAIERTLPNFKHLWEGQPKVGDNILEQEELMTSDGRSDKELYDGPPVKRRFFFDEAKEKFRQGKKGTCQMCGGSGGDPWGDPGYKCPQCDGTGECQHKNVVEVKDDFPVRIYCDDCQQYLKDRRTGEQQERKCLKCGGSKRERFYADGVPGWDEEGHPVKQLFEKDCPQCDGTGNERRIGGERRVNKKPGFYVMFTKGLWYLHKDEGISLTLFPDIRDGEDRRK